MKNNKEKKIKNKEQRKYNFLLEKRKKANPTTP